MKSTAKQLAMRRQELLALGEQQRLQLVAQGNDVEMRLTNIDRVIDVVRSFATRPIVLIAAAAGAILLGPRRILTWVSRGAMFLTMFRKLRELFS
ncbi:MAG TPA: YqjK family protein [Steroidobacteraceae bacterium]|nr:YqjK family protein [Steroidobacteraceae bacterium]